MEDTTSLYEYNNSLYIKDDTNTNYYECEYCHDYATDNSLGCASHSHTNETQYYCTNCGTWGDNHTHTVHHDAVTREETCQGCDGAGVISINIYGANLITCPSCQGNKKVTIVVKDAYDEEVSYITETRTYCTTCEQYNVSGTGCKHSIITSTIYKKYIKQYGSGSANIYLTDDFNSTGYYWNSNVGALKVGTVFTHTDSCNYIVRGVNDGVVYATRQT